MANEDGTVWANLKVRNDECKAVLRQIAKERLLRKVATKPKQGFGSPIDKRVDKEFKVKMKETFSDGSSVLLDFFNSKTYRPVIDAFCSGGSHPDLSRDMLSRMAIMFLSAQRTLSNNSQPANARNNNYEVTV